MSIVEQIQGARGFCTLIRDILHDVREEQPPSVDVLERAHASATKLTSRLDGMLEQCVALLTGSQTRDVKTRTLAERVRNLSVHHVSLNQMFDEACDSGAGMGMPGELTIDGSKMWAACGLMQQCGDELARIADELDGATPGATTESEPEAGTDDYKDESLTELEELACMARAWRCCLNQSNQAFEEEKQRKEKFLAAIKTSGLVADSHGVIRFRSGDFAVVVTPREAEPFITTTVDDESGAAAA